MLAEGQEKAVDKLSPNSIVYSLYDWEVSA